MFGRRRRRIQEREMLANARAASVVPPEHTRLMSDEKLYEVVLERIESYLGDDGSWTLVRRDPGETDTLFRDVATTTLAQAVTRSIVQESAVLDATDIQAVPVAQESPAVVSAPAFSAEDVTARIAFELDTIAVWADPRRHDPDFVELPQPAAKQSSRSIA